MLFLRLRFGPGALLYEMLAGRPPFKAETPLATLQLVTSVDPVAPRQLQAHLAAGHAQLGMLYQFIRRGNDALAQFLRALALREELTGRFPNEPAPARTHDCVGNLFVVTLRPAQAEKYYRQALKLRREWADRYSAAADLGTLPGSAMPYRVNRVRWKGSLPREQAFGLIRPDLFHRNGFVYGGYWDA